MKFRTACLRLVALVGSVGFTPVAFAMPNGLPHAQQLAKSGAGVEGVRWICNPWGRCRWRPTSMARTPLSAAAVCLLRPALLGTRVGTGTGGESLRLRPLGLRPTRRQQGHEL